MSDMHVGTGRVEVRPCDLCGTKVEHRESKGVALGVIAWSAANHDAPCGAPCMGGGLGREARERLKPLYKYWIDGSHGHLDNGKRVCPNGCTFEKSEYSFGGIRVRTISTVDVLGGDHRHTLTVAEYSFPDGSVEPYVEVSEPGRPGKARVIALSTAVHALMNLGEMEIFQVGNREEPNED